MPSNLHEDAHRINGKLGVNCLKLRSPLPGTGIPVATIKVPSPRAFGFFGAFELSVQISVAWMKSAAFLRASASIVSFCSAKENLKRPLLRSFKKEVYATPSSKLIFNTAS